MKDFEFYVPEQYKEYIMYILTNSNIEYGYREKDFETIHIFEYKNGTFGYEAGFITKERDWLLLSYEEGFKILYKYYKKHYYKGE